MKIRLTALCIFCLLVGGTSAWAGTVSAGAAGEASKAGAAPAAAGPTLTETQKQALQAIDDGAKKKAAPIALRFARIVKDIYENMLADKPDVDLRAKLDNEMKETTWELLSIKGQSIRDSVALLTPEQKLLVRAEMAKPGAPADLMEVLGKTFKPAGK